MVRRMRRGDERAFVAFVAGIESRLRQALIAQYGPVDGREAAVDALSWAWEHWDQVQVMKSPVGYLFRVGQSATRNFSVRAIPTVAAVTSLDPAAVAPELLPALRRLPDQQRTVVVLVHGFGWSQAEVAELLEVSRSTVHEHLQRALARLRHDLEVIDVD